MVVRSHEHLINIPEMTQLTCTEAKLLFSTSAINAHIRRRSRPIIRLFDDLYLAGCTRNRKSDPRRRLGSLLADACGFMREDAWRLLDLVGVDLIKVVE
jgi:hypothetical protein